MVEELVSNRVKDTESGYEVRVAIRKEPDHARARTKLAERAVRPSNHAHMVPQNSCAEEAAHHRCRTLDALIRVVQPAGLAHMVHLRGDDESLEWQREIGVHPLACLDCPRMCNRVRL